MPLEAKINICLIRKSQGVKPDTNSIKPVNRNNLPKKQNDTNTIFKPAIV